MEQPGVSFDDLVLSLQRAIDRIIRRLRRGAAPERTQKPLLIVQIDGLSRFVLARALDSGQMPFLARLLERHGYRQSAMSVGLPTSTPAFQMAMMYGIRPDIPGFHYYDRARRGDIHFPRLGHAAWVEARQASGRTSILKSGSTYGAVFAGGADNSFFSFARLKRAPARGLVSALSAFVVLGWVIVKSLARTVVEIVRAILRFIADPLGQRRGWRWLAMQIGMSVWVRGFFTYSVVRDLYAGTPAVYVNYLDYDVAAHAFGPESRRAIRTLRRVDRAIHQIWRVMRRVPEHQYDLYVLADHGQAASRPYRELTAGRRLDILDALAPLDADTVNQWVPGLAEELSRSVGVGFVLARSAEGPVCFRAGKRYQLSESDPGPFGGRPDAAAVVDGITDLMSMPSAGDLVIYGIDAPQGHVSFIPEQGAHAGPSPEEMPTFILDPATVTLPPRLSHPVQLYDHFIRYRTAS